MSEEKNNEQGKKPVSGKSQSAKPESLTGSTTESSQREGGNKSAAAPPPPPAKSGGGGFLAVLALLLAAGGLAAGYQAWQSNESVVTRLHETDAALEARLNELEQRTANIAGQLQSIASSNQNVGPQLAALRDRLEDQLKEVVTALEGQLAAAKEDASNRIAQQFAILQDAVNALQAKLEEKKPEERQKPLWEPAEAEFLIRLADESLRLRGDVRTAVAALREADQRLQAVGHPAFATTRRLIAEEIQALLAVPQVDVPAALATLGNLQERVTELPLRNARQEVADEREQEVAGAEARAEASGGAEEERSSWQAFFYDLGDTIKSLVTVRRRDVTDEPLIPPQRVLYLTQNLQLKLETARLALLRGEESAYHNAIQAAIGWISRYYVNDDEAVQDVLATLRQLDELVIRPELPSVKPSLEALREVLESRAYLSAHTLSLDLAAQVPASGDGSLLLAAAGARIVKGGEQP